MLSKQLVGAHLLRVQYLNQGLCVFRQGSCKYHEFVVLVHFLQKLAHSWSHQYKDIADAAFNLNRQDNVWVVNGFEGGMY